MDSDQSDSSKKLSLLMAILPIAMIVALLLLQLFVFDDFMPHIPLVLGIPTMTWRFSTPGCFSSPPA